MKSYEEFSTSVYAKAETRRQKIRERRSMLRNTALCVAAVLTVAAFTGIYSRDRAGLDMTRDMQQINQATENAPRKIGGGDRPQMLVVMKEGGEAKAHVLRNPEDQQAFVGQLSPAESERKASLKQEDSEAITIYSLVEFLDYLKQLPADSVPEMGDYDEAFFAENNLCVMPMNLDTDEGMTEFLDGSSGDVIPSTIPDDAATEDMEAENVSPTEDGELDSTEPTDENAVVPEHTARPPFPSYEAGDASGSQLLQRFVRAFILLPVRKAVENMQ